MSNLKLRSLVDSFVSSIEAEIRSAALEAVASALGGAKPSAPKVAAPAPAAKRGRPKKTAATAPAKKSVTVADLAPKSNKAAAKAPSAKKPAAGKRNRRSAEDLDRDVAKLVAYVKANPGTSTEKARAGLKLEREIWKSTVARAIETKQVARKGERREATLHLG